jgi:hypothetical protein
VSSSPPSGESIEGGHKIRPYIQLYELGIGSLFEFVTNLKSFGPVAGYTLSMRTLFVIAVFVSAKMAMAQASATTPDLRDISYARNIGMGGAYEAMGYGVEALNGNPAAMSLYKRYTTEASGSWDVPQGYGFGTFGLIDSTNPLTMGIGYHFATYGGQERRWAHLTTLGFAYSLADWIHFGLALRHQVILGGTNTNSVTTTAGLALRPVSFLTLGFSGHNLIPNFNPDITRYFVASIAGAILGQITPAFDLRMDFNQPVARFAFHGGIEWLVAETFPLRLGYQYDGITNHQYMSFGIGWFSSGSGIDLSYRHELEGQKGQLISLSLKLQISQ